MKRRRKRVALVTGGILFIVIAVFFVFGGNVLQVYQGEEFFGDLNIGDDVSDEEDMGGGSVNAGEDVEASSGGGGGSGGSGSGLDCITKRVQYSLKNFRESAVCVESDVVGCVKMVVNCSVDVYNFGNDVGIFRILYYLADSGENKLDSELVGLGVNPDDFEVFEVGFIWEDENGVDEDLSCPFIMDSIPVETVCN